MIVKARRAGLRFGVIGLVFALATPWAGADEQDLRTTQVLLEGPLFLSMAEVDAAFARLDADRAAAKGAIPNAMTYFESGGAGFGQSERAGRIGSGGSATQMRVGADREVRPGVVVGAMASVGFGSLGSGDLGATALGRHADFYAKFTEGALFAKALVGASQFGFNAIERGAAGPQCRADASGLVARAAGQIGGSTRIGGVTMTPTVTVTALGDRLSGYSERGANGARFASRMGAATIGAVRLAGSRSVRIDPKHKLKIEAFVAAEEVVGFRASDLKATVAGERVRAVALGGAPTGRGLVGGLGLGTSLMDGVTLQVNYDYGRRDGVSTRTTRGRIGVSF
ncbi:MAG: hypothetical protein DI565_06435 [Ancylobacter novellus]|uniref:Autotransporter domain-containing protein n=1 Tax=Ancylobacter novellus TaxID=921 RepID=A0A2W5KLU6_ANCNO|nr:MAG: hypothetical protein DI565_06435 [Ancylobacter novellus]